MPDDRVNGLVARLELGGDPAAVKELRALVAHVVAMGATDDEVLFAGRREALAALALDYAIRPPGDAVPLTEFAGASGLDPVFVRRILLALGLREPDDGPLLIAPDLAQAIDTLALLAAALGEDAALGLARVIGASTAQLAEALASAIRVGVEVPERDSGVPYADVVVTLIGRAREVLPAVWDAVGAVFRRQLVAASYQRWRPDEARTAITMTRTVGFVDLVGSTDVLSGQSVAELAASVNRFEVLVWDLLTGAGGRVVKLIGDEAMFVMEDSATACRVALALVAHTERPVRVGLAHGEVVAFHGDFYGPPVNLASRLVAAAQPGTIVVAESVVAATGAAVAVEPVDIGPVRGFPDVTRAYRVVDG